MYSDVSPGRARATLHGLLCSQVRLRPEHAAIEHRGRTLSYRQLQTLACDLGRVLCDAGVGRGNFVAVALDRTPESVAFLYAISMAGAAFVPLDPFWPRARLRLILDDVRPSHVVAAERFRDLIGNTDGKTLALEEILQRTHRAARSIVSDNGMATGADIAYVMYTSGTTGAPKGVMIEHRAAVSTLRSVRHVFDYTPDDRVYQLAAWTFDPAVFQIFGTLGAGACVVLNGTGDGLDFAAIADEIVDRRVTVFDTAPAILGPLLDQRRLGQSSLRMIGSGGAVARGELRDRALTRLGLSLQNHYGPTETAILATTYRTLPSDTDARIPIGFPIDGTYAYVLDADRRPVPRGSEGELYIGGRSVGRGYLNSPELTASRFFPNPFCAGAGARMYRSGDIVRERHDGALEFIGRVDNQVKIRGVRVELEEVEHVLARESRVDGVAMLLDGEDGNERLIAFAASRNPGDGLAETLAQIAAEQLPVAARPARIDVIDALPLLPLGKIDVAALRRLAQQRRDVAIGRDTLQDAIARIWRDVLGHADFGMDDDFFTLGGNSLAAARCAAQIAEQFGRRIPIAVLFADATIAKLAAVLRSDERATLAPIVQIATGTKSPFFFLHGDYTGVGLYVRRFAGLLDGDRPIFSLPPHGADGGDVPPTLRAMAEDHLAVIRAVQPTGPYVLGGFCMGAIVALEVAQLLARGGERVSHIVAIDAHEIVPRTGLRRLLNVVRKAVRRTDLQTAHVPNIVIDPTTAHVAPAYDRALNIHRWRKAAAPVTFLCSQDETGGIDDAQIVLRWKPFVRTMNVQRIGGNHTTALTSYVRETCAAIAAVLERIPEP